VKSTAYKRGFARLAENSRYGSATEPHRTGGMIDAWSGS